MTICTRFVAALTLTVFAFFLNAVAQTPQMSTVNISPDSGKVHVSTIGDVYDMRIEVSNESGEVVFESGQVSGQTLDWNMKDSQGERVTPGTYTVSVSYRTQAGKLMKRIEQVTVTEAVSSGDSQEKTPRQTNSSTTPNIVTTITGEGTINRIAKFTGPNTIDDSVISESAGKIGINNAAPTHALSVNGGPLWTSNGWTGSIALPNASAIGWAANAGGQRGGIGHGSSGLYFFRTASDPGTTASPAVYDMLISDSGNVGIGTTTPLNGQLHVVGTNGQTGVYGRSDNNAGVRGSSDSATGVYGSSGSYVGVYGTSGSGDGVYGSSSGGYAGNFYGKAKVSSQLEVGGNEFFGSSVRQMINLFGTAYGIGVQSGTQYFRTASGFAWFKGGTHSNSANNPGTGGTRLMKLDSAGNLTATSFNPTSDRNMKSNFSAVNPRFILDKLAAIPIQTWSYKTEDNSVRHIGPVAQDFRAAFNLGMNDKTISTVDADGVTMAAVQGLYQMMLEKDRQIGQLQAQLNQVRRTIKRKRAARK